MLQQVSDRAEAMFVRDNDRVDSSLDTQEIATNPLSKRLFPQQQALTLDEKLQLVKHDQLSTQTEESRQFAMSDDQQADQSDSHGNTTNGPCDSPDISGQGDVGD